MLAELDSSGTVDMGVVVLDESDEDGVRATASATRALDGGC